MRNQIEDISDNENKELFAIVPQAITGNPFIKSSEKVVITHLLGKYRIKTLDGTPWTFSNIKIQEGTGLKERTVQRIIEKYVKLKVLKYYGKLFTGNTRPTKIYIFNIEALNRMLKKDTVKMTITELVNDTNGFDDVSTASNVGDTVINTVKDTVKKTVYKKDGKKKMVKENKESTYYSKISSVASHSPVGQIESMPENKINPVSLLPVISTSEAVAPVSSNKISNSLIGGGCSLLSSEAPAPVQNNIMNDKINPNNAPVECMPPASITPPASKHYPKKLKPVACSGFDAVLKNKKQKNDDKMEQIIEAMESIKGRWAINPNDEIYYKRCQALDSRIGEYDEDWQVYNVAREISETIK